MNVYVAQWLGCRDSQEDAYAVRHFPHGVLAVVCDGMGGHALCGMASRTAAAAFVEAFAAREGDGENIPTRLRAALAATNAAVGEAFTEQGSYGGTTLLAAYVGSGLLWWVSVGDSPLLLWRAGRLMRLNEDHSLRPVYLEYARKGLFSFEEAMNDGHSLRSAITGGELKLIDAPLTPHPMLPGDRLVLATDGVDNLLLPHPLPEAARHIFATHDKGNLAALIVEACRALGNPAADNTTVVAFGSL